MGKALQYSYDRDADRHVPIRRRTAIGQDN
jgi:hypothetical protein